MLNSLGRLVEQLSRRAQMGRQAAIGSARRSDIGKVQGTIRLSDIVGVRRLR
jgi:hypothetical protein